MMANGVGDVRGTTMANGAGGGRGTTKASGTGDVRGTTKANGAGGGRGTMMANGADGCNPAASCLKPESDGFEPATMFNRAMTRMRTIFFIPTLITHSRVAGNIERIIKQL